MRFKALFLTLGIVLILAGCRPLTEDLQPAQSDFVPLQSGQTIGQTFAAHFDGLGGVGLLIKPETPGTGEIKLILHTSPESLDHLREAKLPISSIAYPGYSYFYFPPLSDSSQKDYYFTLRLDGEGSVSVGTAGANTYVDGAIYQNGHPKDGQLTIQLVYGMRRLIAGLVPEVLYWFLWILIAIFLFILPGWGLLSITYPDWDTFGFWWKFGLSSCLSLAIYPLFILWTDLIGVHLGILYAWLPGAVGSTIILFRNWQKIIHVKPKSIRSIRVDFPAVSLLILVCLVTLVRFWVIRGLDIPMWGDSYQHTMIAQLLVDHGGLFKSWQPYAELQSFTYHFGYHSLVAVFHWISQMALPQAMLWTGQIMNILAVVALYPLTLRITKNPWSGVFSVLLAGLLFSMPMFYINWGRYTQLAGLVLLPGFVLLAWETLESKKTNWPMMILSCVVLGGLALTHYRILIFAIVFLGAYTLVNIPSGHLVQKIMRIIMICVGGMLLALPWYINTFAGKLVMGFSNQVTTPASQLTPTILESNAIGDLFTYLPAWAWLSLPLIIGWGLWKRQKGIALISLWWYLILLAANPQWLKLPGAGIITSFAVMIAAYFPASILIGAAIGWISETLLRLDGQRKSNRQRTASIGNIVIPVGLIALLLIGGLWGAQQRLKDVEISRYALAVHPDLHAAEWIKENTSSDAGFLVNSSFAYAGSVIVGTDGGWWLPLLANRRTTLPPLPYSTEQGPRPDYREWINQLTEMIKTKGINDPKVLDELSKRGINYIYIGQQQGLVNSKAPLINLAEVLMNPNFIPIFHQDQVWIFEILPGK